MLNHETKSASSQKISFMTLSIHLLLLDRHMYKDKLQHDIINAQTHIYVYIYTNQEAIHGPFFKQSSISLNSEFSFSKIGCFTKDKELKLYSYLLITGRRIVGWVPFPWLLTLCEMQTVSFRIWTRFVISISYDDNHYTTRAYIHEVCLKSDINKLHDFSF